MNKKILWAFLLSVAIVIPAAGFVEDSSNESGAANTGASTEATTTRIIINREVMKRQREVRKQDIEEIKDVRIQSRSFINEVKVEVIEDERNKKIGEIRTNAKNAILEKREALKTNLKKISDQRKVRIVESTDKKLEKINDDRTGHLLDVLNQLEKTLAKINVRINAAEAKGVDVSFAKKASDDASKAIVAARTAVETQAAKVYKMTITTEAKLKADVENTVKKLQNELEQIRIIVQTAHDAVRKVAVALAKAMGLENKPKSNSAVSSSVSSSGAVNSSSSPDSSEAASSQSSS